MQLLRGILQEIVKEIATWLRSSAARRNGMASSISPSGACGVPFMRSLDRRRRGDIRGVTVQNVKTELVRHHPTHFKAKSSGSRIIVSLASRPAILFGTTSRKDALSVAVRSSAPLQPEPRETEDDRIIGNSRAFNWRQNWYPIAFIQDVPIGLPYKFTLFDEPMVVFMREEGDLSPGCFVDRCPHRRAPLSEGALTEDGDVMCAYHG